jgi:hypothetical protein
MNLVREGGISASQAGIDIAAERIVGEHTSPDPFYERAFGLGQGLTMT